MSNPSGNLIKSADRKVPHNWTKDTLGKCAITHMEQLCNAYFNYAGPQRDLAMGQIIESYNRIEVSVVNGLNFTTV